MDISHLFGPLSTDVMLRNRAPLSDDAYDFISLLAPSLTRTAIDEARAALLA